jgi:hypothetical protein
VTTVMFSLALSTTAQGLHWLPESNSSRRGIQSMWRS